MATQMIVSAESLEKFSQLADLLEKASVVMRELSSGKASVLKQDPFWRDCAELQAAFSDLTPKEIDVLIDQAVKGVRSGRVISKQ